VATPTAIPTQNVAAILLAAGTSRRMAPHHKLLETNAANRPMVAVSAEALLASRAHPVIAVLGHQAENIRAALRDRPLTCTITQDYHQGLSASLRAGLAALPQSTHAALICLADMPYLTPALINTLIAAYDPTANRLIIRPTFQGRPGNPVLWDRRFFPALQALEGDTGARALLAADPESITTVPVDSPAVLHDIDTPEALAAWRATA
jgi:molybdenum cofactor cytidylyltransferase